MPTLTISEFKAMKAIKPSIQHAGLQWNGSLLALFIDAEAKSLHGGINQPLYWGCGEYAGKHDAAGLTHATALVLEYDASERTNLEAALKGLDYQSLVLNTERKDGNTVCAIIALEAPIADARLYTRIASIVANQIGVHNIRDSHTHTFLFQPISRTRTVAIGSKAIDPEALEKAHAGTIQNFSKWEGPSPLIRAVADRTNADTALAGSISSHSQPRSFRFDEHFGELSVKMDSVFDAAYQLKRQIDDLRKGGR